MLPSETKLQHLPFLINAQDPVSEDMPWPFVIVTFSLSQESSEIQPHSLCIEHAIFAAATVGWSSMGMPLQNLSWCLVEYPSAIGHTGLSRVFLQY